MRIVHVHVHKNTANDARVRKTLQYQRERGAEAYVVTSGPEPPKEPIEFPVRWVPLEEVSSVRGRVLELEPDLIHCHELDALWAVLSRWRAWPNPAELSKDELFRLTSLSVDEGWCRVHKPPGVWIVYEAHEYERDRTTLPEEIRLDRILREERCVPLTDSMAVVSPSIQKQTREDLDVEAVLMPNAPFHRRVTRTQELRELVGAKDGQRILVFCGNVTRSRGLRLLAETAQILGETWKLALVGAVTHAEDEELEALKNAGAHFLDPRPYPYRGVQSSFLELIGGADVAWCIGDMRVSNVRMWLPNKFFEFGFAGVPMVFNADAPDVCDLAKAYRLGLEVETDGSDPTTAQACADQVHWAAGLRPKTERFVDDWCYEATCGPALEAMYGS